MVVSQVCLLFRHRLQILIVLALKRSFFICVAAAFGWLGATSIVFAADPPMKILLGHVPASLAYIMAKGILPATNRLSLAIGLPLRDVKGLDAYLTQLYDPTSPDYRRYLTPDQFTEKFGPTEQSYQAVIDFVEKYGLTVTATHRNRLLLDVSGAVADVQRAFHVTMHSYRHPNGKRDFYAPDTEPMVESDLPIADISGLNNYVLPHPKNIKMNTAAAMPQLGSGGGGSYLGNDFRAAYLPGVTLTGSGQMIGLVEFDGFYSGDIVAYENLAGLPNVPVQTVLLDNSAGTPGEGNVEVALDIEMAISMAPGLSKVVVYEGNSPNDVLNSMAANNQIKQFSCSWGWGGVPNQTTDAIFKQMAAQGQSFFNASGDSDAFTPGPSSVNGVDNATLDNAPSSSPYITQVGGTTLVTTGPGGAYASETVWNWGGGTGSSGGVSSFYAIPSWQMNVNMTANGGSTAFRNIPDVAWTADNVYVAYGNGTSETVGGTSCAAPLWAGFMALVNQQAAEQGQSSEGFINPAIYAIGAGQNYSQDFHDITAGDNTWDDSLSQFFAVQGYDDCTGWGTPAGQNLINDLVTQKNSTPLSLPNVLGIFSITPTTDIAPIGGPFNSPASVILLTNSGTGSLTWTLTNPKAVNWLSVSPTSGTLAPQGTARVTLNFNTVANTLAAGQYPASFEFSSANSTTIQTAAFQLQVMPVLSVLPTTGFIASGAVGGPFLPATETFNISNLSAISSTWKGKASASWLAVSRASGTVAAHGQTTFTVSLKAAAKKLRAGAYRATVTLEDKKNRIIQILPFTLSIGQNHIAAPEIQNVASTPASFDLTFTATSGESYQVQYKTNLTQTDWINLGDPIQAETNSVKFSDTDIGNYPQKYYRLMVVH